MKPTIKVLTAIVLIFYTMSVLAAASDNFFDLWQAKASDYFGHWRITGIADYAEITAISSANAKKRINSEVIVLANKMHFYHHNCKPKYQLTTINTAKFLADSRVTNQHLKLPDPVLVIDPNCERGWIMYIIGPNHLILDEYGAYYQAERIKPKKTKRQ